MNTNNRPGPARLSAERLTGYIKAYGARLPERHVRMLWQHQRQLSLVEEEMGLCEREIAGLLASPRFAATAALLVTAPGVGPVVTATVLAEVGNFLRFPDGKAIGRYAGLTPRLFASGGKERHGHICKTGPRDLRLGLATGSLDGHPLRRADQAALVEDQPRLGPKSRRRGHRSSTARDAVAYGASSNTLPFAGPPGGGVRRSKRNEC